MPSFGNRFTSKPVPPSPPVTAGRSVVLNTNISSNNESTVISSTPARRAIHDEWLKILRAPHLNKRPNALAVGRLLRAMHHTAENPQGFVERSETSFPAGKIWRIGPFDFRFNRLRTWLSGSATISYYKEDPISGVIDKANKSQLGLSSNKARMWAIASWVTTVGSIGLACMSTTMQILPALAISSSVTPLAGIALPVMIGTGIIAAGKFVCEEFINKELSNQYDKLTRFQLEQNAAGTAMSRETMLIQALLAYRVVSQPPWYATRLNSAVLFDKQTNHPGYVMGRPLLQAMAIVVENWEKLKSNNSDPTAANSIRLEYDKQIQLLLKPREEDEKPSYARQFAGALRRVNDLPEMAQESIGTYVGYLGFSLSAITWGALKLFVP